MGGWRVMCVAGVILAGCAEEQPLIGGASIDEQGRIWSSAGSRLQPRVLRAPSGLVVPYDVFDSTLGAPCQPTPQKDGSIRCLPVLPHATLNMFFQDASCTQTLAAPIKGDLPPGTLVADVRQEDCLGTMEGLVRLTGQVAPGTPFFYRANPGDPCEARNLSYNELHTIEVVMDAPVVLTPQRLAMDERISARVLVGDDGSHIVTGEFHDILMNAPVLSDETDHLIPPRVRWVKALRRDAPPTDRTEYPAWCQGHGDFLPHDRCEITAALTHVALVDDERGARPSVFKVKHQEEAATRCSAAHGVYLDVHPAVKQVGALLDGPVPEDRWVRGHRVEVSDGRVTWLEPEEFAVIPVAVRTVAVGGRLALRPRGPSTRLQDSQLGAPCGPALAADGNTRCLPVDKVPSFVLAWPVYLDVECTEMAAQAWRFAAQPPRHLMVPVTNPPDPSLAPTRVFRVEEALADPPIFVRDHETGVCRTQSLDPSYQIYRAGDEIPPEMFVPLTVEFP
jgi:hypothetical protein